MNILAVDTALASCSVAVLRNGARASSFFESMERGQAEAIAPMVELAVKNSGLSYPDFDRLGVTIGPGTFTGQRVGLAFMRGMRVALARPLIGVTTLAAMAYAAMAETGLSRAAAVQDARNGNVYLELCDHDSAPEKPLLVSLCDATRIVGKFLRRGPAALAGSARNRLRLNGSLANAALSGIFLPDALWVARLAERAAYTSKPPAPLYLEPPAAKIPGPVK